MSLRVPVSPRRTILLLTVASLLFVAALGSASTAQAGQNWFCNANGTFRLVGANGYCVGAGYHTLNQVAWSLKNGSGVYHCAVAKQYSDGSGHNAIPAGCNSAQIAYSGCQRGTYDPSYPKGTNESASSHYYIGSAAYGNDIYGIICFTN
jgi:hypothetical protein